jgi:hypothetical protein
VGKLVVLFGSLSLGLCAVLIAYLVMPREGQLRVELATAAGASIGRSEIFADGRRLCETAPCKMSLPAGTRTIKVIAPGYLPSDTVMTLIRAGREQRLVIPLTPVEEASSGAAGSTAAAKTSAPATDTSAPTASPPAAKQSAAIARRRGPPVARAAAKTTPAAEEATDEADEPEPQGSGTLSIESNPPSKVLLDGAALGTTSHRSLTVPAGTHTVTFIHPDLGKRSMAVDVAAGKSAGIAVDFRGR